MYEGLMPKLNDAVAARIRELRLAKGWSQEELAEEAELSRDAIARIERGARAPRLDTLDMIAEAFGISLPVILSFEQPLPRRTARDDSMRSLERALNHLEPWLAKALIHAVRLVAQAQVRAKRGKPRAAPRRRVAPHRRRRLARS
jgi:XRE family transcriptional regulator, regulator of sulfur utilization